MFRFETVVKCALLCLALSNCPAYAAGDGGTVVSLGGGGKENCAQYYQIYLDAKKEFKKLTNPSEDDKKDLAEAKKASEDCNARNSKNGDPCANAPDNFQKAMTDFANACSDANMGGKCETEVAKCNKTNKTEGSSSSRSNGRDPNQPYDVDGVKKQCPAMAATDIKDLEKELKDQREKYKKLQDELPKIEEEANTKQSKNNDKLQELKQQMADKQKKTAEDMQKISEDKDGAEKAITDQVTAISAQVLKAKDALNQVSLTKLDGQVKLKQTKTQADLNCHASASAQVAKMQTDVLEGIKSGTYNGGGFTNVMKSVGLSDRQRWQKIANKYYQWCLNSKPTKDTKDGANDGYRLLVAQANKSEDSIHEQIKQLQAQQQTLMSPAACAQAASMQANGSGGGETQLCQAARKAYQRSQQLQQAAVTDQQQATEKYQQLSQQGQQEIQTLRNKYMAKSQEASEEKSRLDNLQRYLEAKYEKSNGSSTVDGKGLAKATTLLTSTEAAARKLVACTRKAADKKDLDNDTWCDSDCASARDFAINAIGKDKAANDPLLTNAEVIESGPHAPAIDDSLAGGGKAKRVSDSDSDSAIKK